MELTAPGSPWLWRQTSGTYTQGGTQTLKPIPSELLTPHTRVHFNLCKQLSPLEDQSNLDIPDLKELRSPSLHPLIKPPLLELAPILGLLSLCQNPNHDRNLLVTLHS